MLRLFLLPVFGWMILFWAAAPSLADDHFLVDLVGNGQGSLQQIIPSEGQIYRRNCEMRVDGIDLNSVSRMSMRGAAIICDGHRISEPSVQFKKTEGHLYLIDEDGYISSTSDGTYTANGELHFSFRRSLSYNLNEVQIKNCQTLVVNRADTLNSYTEYELVKNGGDLFQIVRNTTYEIFESVKFQIPECPGVTGEYFEKKTYSHQFRGQLKQLE